MARLNLILLAVLVVCALSVVTSQHKARKLYVELQKEQELAKQLEVEWGQLQLEQSTWAMHARIEKIASGQLMMRVPPAVARAGGRAGGGEMSAAAPPASRCNLPGWRSRAAARAAARSVSACWSRAPSICRGCNNDFLQKKGEVALRPRDRTLGDARHDHRPQPRTAGDLDAGRIGVGESRATSKSRRRR